VDDDEGPGRVRVAANYRATDEVRRPWVIAGPCPATWAAAKIIMPSPDTETIDVFLGELSRQPDPDVRAVLFRDGAGSRTARAFEVPVNVSPVRLPPFSPEPNPIENLRHYLRAHYESNRSYPDRGGLMETTIAGTGAARTDVDPIGTACAVPYLARPERAKTEPRPTGRRWVQLSAEGPTRTAGDW
jgi:hypothetical protein